MDVVIIRLLDVACRVIVFGELINSHLSIQSGCMKGTGK